MWHDIPGYEGLYKISKFGQILRLARRLPYKIAGKTQLIKTILLRFPKDKDGYLKPLLLKTESENITVFTA